MANGANAACNFFDCTKNCQHEHKKTKWLYVYFCRYKNIFLKSLLLGNLAVKITTKQREAFIWFPQNVLLFGNVLTAWHFFPTNIQNKEDISMDCKTKFIVVVIRCDLVFYAFLRKFLSPKIPICRNVGTFSKSGLLSVWCVTIFKEVLKQIN